MLPLVLVLLFIITHQTVLLFVFANNQFTILRTQIFPNPTCTGKPKYTNYDDGAIDGQCFVQGGASTYLNCSANIVTNYDTEDGSCTNSIYHVPSPSDYLIINTCQSGSDGYYSKTDCYSGPGFIISGYRNSSCTGWIPEHDAVLLNVCYEEPGNSVMYTHNGAYLNGSLFYSDSCTGIANISVSIPNTCTQSSADPSTYFTIDYQAASWHPTHSPSKSPSKTPHKPTKSPSHSPLRPTKNPSKSPSKFPSRSPSRSPSTSKPSKTPLTSKPSKSPSHSPTHSGPTVPTLLIYVPPTIATHTKSPVTTNTGVAATISDVDVIAASVGGSIFVLLGGLASFIIFTMFKKKRHQQLLLDRATLVNNNNENNNIFAINPKFGGDN
jgi:hypothetical protein